MASSVYGSRIGTRQLHVPPSILNLVYVVVCVFVCVCVCVCVNTHTHINTVFKKIAIIFPSHLKPLQVLHCIAISWLTSLSHDGLLWFACQC